MALVPAAARERHGQACAEDQPGIHARHRFAVDEAKVRDAVELAHVARELEEREEGGALPGAEPVAELLEIARQEARRVAVAVHRLVGEHLGLRARFADGRDERVLELLDAFGRGVGARPDGEDHREARALGPDTAEIVVRGRILERAPKSGVADQELRVRRLVERHVARVREQDASEHDRRRALGRDPDRPDLVDRLRRDELDRVDRAFGGDAQAREEAQAIRVACPLDGRDRRDVDLAGEELLRQLDGDALDFVHLGLQSVEDRRHVHVGDAAEADHRTGSDPLDVHARPREPGTPLTAPLPLRLRARPRACQ